MDYRELNQITSKNAYSLPNANDEIQRAAKHNYYAFFDLEDGFWHITVHDEDREKIVFVAPSGIYEWFDIFFGICKALVTLQNFMKEVLNHSAHL